jgi:flagellar biosynthetic protein FliP
MSTRLKIVFVVVGLLTLLLWSMGSPASAQGDDPTPPTPSPAPTTATESEEPASDAGGLLSGLTGTETPDDGETGGIFDGDPGPADTGDGTAEDTGSFNIDVQFDQGEESDAPSRTVTILLGLTILAVAPSILLMMTSFTRIVVVLSLTRNALGVQAIPPNQVLVGLAMFLTFFVMAPVMTQINDDAVQPYLDGQISQSEALKEAEGPIKDFMLANTRSTDLEMMISMSGGEQPEEPEDTSLVALVPAFVLSELQSAFIIGIVLFVPFVVLDLVVSAVLMSLGMMMLPPVFISLPLKLLVFVMVDGWALTVEALVANYRSG